MVEVHITNEGQRFDDAQKEYKLALAEIHRLIHHYHNTGMPKAVIARRLGISRQTVYNVLRR